MERKIKLIWDFFGPDAKEIAHHHQIHLEEFAIKENLAIKTGGIECVNDNKWIAFLPCIESEMIKIRDAVKPQRGELLEE